MKPKKIKIFKSWKKLYGYSGMRVLPYTDNTIS